jgi:hypothetical protein
MNPGQGIKTHHKNLRMVAIEELNRRGIRIRARSYKIQDLLAAICNLTGWPEDPKSSAMEVVREFVDYCRRNPADGRATGSDINLMERPAMCMSLAMRITAERARQDAPALHALASNVDPSGWMRNSS